MYCNNEDHKSTECTKEKGGKYRGEIFYVQNDYVLTAQELGIGLLIVLVKVPLRIAKQNITFSSVKRNETKNIESFGHRQWNKGVIYPVVVVKVSGITCRALLDTDSGSSYIKRKLADLMNRKQVRVEHKKLDTIISTTTRKVEVFQVKLQSLNEHFSIEVEAGRVDRGSC